MLKRAPATIPVLEGTGGVAISPPSSRVTQSRGAATRCANGGSKKPPRSSVAARPAGL